jgi:clan AA aspartic protease
MRKGSLSDSQKNRKRRTGNRSGPFFIFQVSVLGSCFLPVWFRLVRVWVLLLLPFASSPAFGSPGITWYGRAVGVTYVPVKLGSPASRRPPMTVRFMVDSGALYSVLPEAVWRRLKLKSERTAEFVLADGTTITRGVSECRFEIHGTAATSPVVLGEGDDGALLGAVTLETLGLMLNPLNRELVPMRLMLARLRR